MDISHGFTFVPSGSSGVLDISQQQTRQYPPEEWESRRSEIERLYIEEDLNLEELIEKMAKSGFHATYTSPHYGGNFQRTDS